MRSFVYDAKLIVNRPVTGCARWFLCDKTALFFSVGGGGGVVAHYYKNTSKLCVKWVCTRETFSVRHRLGTAEDGRRCVWKDGWMDGWTL